MELKMPGDWIKMRTDLYRDPKVIMIADQLMCEDGQLAGYISQVTQRDSNVTSNVMRNVTVGALVTLWGVTRNDGTRDGDDAIIKFANRGVIDDIVDLPGFGDALASVGWVIEDDMGLRFPRFFELHNVDPSEDQKEKNRDRQRRYRERKRNVTVTSFRNAREEKSRVENISLSLCEGFAEEWKRWCDYFLATQGRDLDEISAETTLMELSRRGPEKAAKDITFSILKNAKSILDSDNDLSKRNQTTKSKNKLRI